MPGFVSTIAKAILACCGVRDSDALYEKANIAYAAYLQSGDPKELKTALQDYKSALAARIKENHHDLGATRVNYATALWAQYERTGKPAEKLPQIIDLDETALTLWNESSPKPGGYPILLLNLATAHFHQYHAKGDANSFTRAVDLSDQLRLYPTVDRDTRRKGLIMLGTELSKKCDMDQKTDRLDEAIEFLEEALSVLKRSNSEAFDEKRQENFATVRIVCFYNLAIAHDVRYQLGKPQGRKDLDNAIKHNYAARKLFPDEHPDRVPCLYNLARQLFWRYERAQKEKGAIVLLDVHLDAKKGVRDLRDAKRIAEEAQKLLADRDAPPELKDEVDSLLNVIQQHSASVSRNTSKNPTPIGSRAPSPSRDSGMGIQDKDSSKETLND